MVLQLSRSSLLNQQPGGRMPKSFITLTGEDASCVNMSLANQPAWALVTGLRAVGTCGGDDEPRPALLRGRAEPAAAPLELPSRQAFSFQPHWEGWERLRRSRTKAGC